VPPSQIDQLIYQLPAIPPIGGLKEGLDPALSDAFYAPVYSPDIKNIRVSGGTWQTRLGMVFFKQIPGSGDVRLLYDFYNDSGQRIRLAARGTGTGGILYDYLEGTDVSFNPTTGGTGLGGTVEPYFQGVTQNNFFYFTDRFGPLRKYTRSPASGNQVVVLTQPTAPAIAPTITPRYYRLLDNWAGAYPYGWVVSNAAGFDLQDDTAQTVPPGGGKAIRLKIIDTGSPINSTITKNISGEAINSQAIAFWLRAQSTKVAIQLQVGIATATDFSFPLKASSIATWLPQFYNIGGLASINFKRFQCVDNFNDSLYRVSRLYLPGNLQGSYRWVYTHYDPIADRESPPSPISGNGNPISFDTIGVSNNVSTVAAFQKAAAITVTSDSGTDASTTKIRIYRSGGVPALTVDSQGRSVWFRVGEIFDQSTTLSNSPAANSTSFTVTSATNISIGDLLVINKGVVGSEEFVVVTNIVGTTITIDQPGLVYSHTAGQSVQIAFLDNVANDQVNTLLPIDLERNDPPNGVKFVGRSPDGRLWLFGNTTKLNQVCVSNRATPDRPQNYEVFPDGVDPLTRKNPVQGWRFQIGGIGNDEQIMWGGFYRDRATVITRRNLYVIDANSQLDWGPLAVNKIHNTGCISKDTVKEVNGWLYWVAEGPRVVRWNGDTRQQPEVVSHLTINVRLNNAPTQYWINWFAEYHSKREGPYYCLFFTPSGATTNIERLDYNIDQAGGAWEPVRYCDGSMVDIPWRASSVRQGGIDVSEMYQAADNGKIYQVEVGNDDDGMGIEITAKTKRHSLEVGVGLVQQVFLRFNAVSSDTITLGVRVGGSEYGEILRTYTVNMVGTGDQDIKVRTHRELQGHWIQFELSGTVYNRPAVRDIVSWFIQHRLGHVALSTTSSP
jgi:hypothetical protein